VCFESADPRKSELEYKGGQPKNVLCKNIDPYLHPTSEGALTLNVEPRIPSSNLNFQALVSSDLLYPSGFWRHNERPHVPWIRPRPQLSAVATAITGPLAFQTTRATTGTEIKIMPSLLLPDRHSSTSIYQCRADTKCKNEHQLLLTKRSGERMTMMAKTTI
jgi:hypothetical protein